MQRLLLNLYMNKIVLIRYLDRHTRALLSVDTPYKRRSNMLPMHCLEFLIKIASLLIYNNGGEFYVQLCGSISKVEDKLKH